MADRDPKAEKAEFRRVLRLWRNSLDPAQRDQWSRAAAGHAQYALNLPRALTIGGYRAIGSEADPLPLLVALSDAGHRVALPVVTERDAALVFRLWSAETPLVPAGFGTSAPGPDAETVLPDLLIVPLLGYDGSGTRLGYGGGYYDRTIAALPDRPLLVGFGFSGQRCDAIAREPHDIALDAVVTETGLVRVTARLAFARDPAPNPAPNPAPLGQRKD
jgi:5-formyltetrahydrofolate cyclo-ligase